MNRTHAGIALLILLLAGCASAPLFTIETDPVGADILIDGKPAGKTPATLKVKFAENAQMVMEKKILIVKLPGYKAKKEVISQEGNKAFKFQLAPDHVESAPAAAEVISKSSATSAQDSQAGISAAVVSEPSVTPGQENQAEALAEVASEPSGTSGQENVAGVKAEVAYKPSVASGQEIQAAGADDVVSQLSATTGP